MGHLWEFEVYVCLFVCHIEGSDCSLSGTDGEEQELWEEMQISKGVKKRPGEQVGRDGGSQLTPFFQIFLSLFLFSCFSIWCTIEHSNGRIVSFSED